MEERTARLMELMIKGWNFVRLLKIFGMTVGVLVAISGCTSERVSPPTPAPTLIINPPATVSNEAVNLERDSPRPGVVSPIPPTWTAEPTVGQTQLPLTSTPARSEPAGESVYYIVQPGDTLGEIAEKFNVTADELARANDLEDIDHIEEGQRLLIP